jgi:hypothetical protein
MLLALSISCAAHISKKRKEKLNSWLNHSQQELVMAWGPPARTGEDGNNGEILIYSQYRGEAYGNSYYQYTMFYVNADKKVYYWRVTKASYPPQQINLSIYRY